MTLFREDEKQLFEYFCDDYDDHLSNAGSNDFMWPDYVTMETRQKIVDWFNTTNGHTNPEENMNANSIFSSDYIIFKYLKYKILNYDERQT